MILDMSSCLPVFLSKIISNESCLHVFLSKTCLPVKNQKTKKADVAFFWERRIRFRVSFYAIKLC